ncbi:MAG TPA: hypothetical protein VFH95_11665 [Candidatus Kapabacteria bacterium]|nr:hypothetical protein [Candidatus Kapabacteria bacterium]
MKMLFGILLSGLLFTAPAHVRSCFAQFGHPRIETRLAADSTIFTMKLDANHPLKPGKTFQVRIHVKPGRIWHVYSSKMSSDGGLTPLTVHVPPELSGYFEITKVAENGVIRTAYDSNFMTVTMAHYKPFDVIATIKVLKKAEKEIPFYLYVHFQTCNETMCMPPRTFAVPMSVLGEKPFKLRIAQAMGSLRHPSGLANVMKSR